MSTTDSTTLLDTIEPDVATRIVSRRDALRKGASMSSATAAALAFGSVPIALAALTKESFGQASTTVRSVLEFAYLLENLEAEFYKAVLGTSAIAAQNSAFAPVRATLTATERATLGLIRDHEIAHVNFLRGQLVGLGATPVTYTGSSFDFTGGKGSGTGPFAAATTTKAVLLAGAQAFEDTGVRAYKGQAGNLLGNADVLQAALRIHSVEARHAAKIRNMRAQAGVDVPFSGTIRGNESGISGLSAAGQAVIAQIYAGETNVSHTFHNGTAAQTVDITALGTNFGGTSAVQAAFDEPLSREAVTDIVSNFIVA